MKLARRAAITLLLAASSALAVKTEYWTQTSADDFAAGTTDGVVISKHGQLRLARQIESLLPKDAHFDSIAAVAEGPDGSIVFGAFPTGEVNRLKDGKLTVVGTFKDQAITAVAFDNKGRVLIGAGGEKGRVYRVEKDGDAPKTIFEQDDVKYVWAIVPDGDRTLLATGPSGGVYSLAADDSVTKLAELDGDNVLCLVKGPDGNLYAGTDGEGLIYRIDGKTNKPFVLYDAAESEISALAFDKSGNLLAATSQVKDEAGAPPATEPSEPAGKPEKSGGGQKIKGKPPTLPKQPDEKPGDAIPADKPAPPEAPASEPAKPPALAPLTAGINATAAEASGTSGNAVYRIDSRGFASELWRGDVVIYGMAVSGDSILLATGDDGKIEEIRPNEEDSSTLARVDGSSVSAILPTKDGSLLVASSDNGDLLKISPGYAKSGTYESDVLDAGMTSNLGKIHVVGILPDGTAMQVQTRSGNVKDPDSPGWADWTTAVPVKEYVPIKSPAARFLQYRLTLSTTNDKSPSVDEVSAAYQKPNVMPHISGVTVAPANDPATPSAMNIAWEATDPNGDDLRYTVYVKAEGQSAWMKLADELTEASYTWASKGVADGRYDVKVVASDARANLPGQGKEASRLSDSVLIDNTPPVIGDIKTDVGGGKATVKLRVVDRAGTVASVETSLDNVDHWQKQLPDDTIADSPEETYTVTLGELGHELSRGQHALAVKATDERGNAALETVTISVP